MSATPHHLDLPKVEPETGCDQCSRAMLIGGQGLVGRNLIPTLLADGYEVLSTGLRPPTPWVDPRVRTRSLDVRSRSDTLALLKEFQPTLVFNLTGHRYHRDMKAVYSVHKDGQESLVAAINQVR